MLITTALTLAIMLSAILLEPLVAQRRLGEVKLATACGWLLALPSVACILWLKHSVTQAVALWLSCLLLTNILLLLLRSRLSADFLHALTKTTLARITFTFRDSLWFNVTSLTWVAKSHGITLILSALGGPALAGLFFILLRLSEIISSLGAISFDVAIGALPQCRTARERKRCFAATCRYALSFSLPCAVAIGLLTSAFFTYWLSVPPPLGWATGGWVAVLGLSVAPNRLITYAALGLGCGRAAGLCGLAEMLLAFAGIGLLARPFGLAGVFLILIASVAAHLPAVRAVMESLSYNAGGDPMSIRPAAEFPLVASR